MKKPTEFILVHPAGIRVSRELKERQLVATGLVGPGERDRLNMWMWYGLPPYKDEQLVLKVSLGFKSGKLDVISLMNLDPKFGNSPAEWSEGKERKRAESLDLWLTARGFPPGRYTWGTVSVVFDEKSGGGSAGVQFRPAPR
ncbi:MAG: hypothetical protein ABI584_05525 [Acidobacteriota bacterium]